jgi:hypothetical protein
MSLATSSGMAGAGGGGGLMMAHNAMGNTVPPSQPPPQSTAGGPMAPPPLLGGDLANKNQSISLKQVKSVAHLPLVGIDLHAAEPHVAYFPPKPADPTEGAMPVLVGKTKPHLYFQSTDTAHKALRKYLTKSKTFKSLQADSLSKPSDPTAVVLRKPHLWLGLRRTTDAPDFVQLQQGTTIINSKKKNENSNASSSHAISEEVSQGVGAVVVNSTLDGSSEPTGDDFDRVVFKVRLHESKKALTMLPEEGVQTILHAAQYHVANKVKESNLDEIVDYPFAVAWPAWAAHDAAVEALMEANSNMSGCCVILSRSTCALAGALLPPVEGGDLSDLVQRILMVRNASRIEFSKTTQLDDPDAIWDEEVTLVLVGMTEEGLECTAVQVSSENGANACALFGDFKVLSNVSYQCADPLSLLSKCATELEENVEVIAPEADGPTGIIFYGKTAEQEKLRGVWDKEKPSEWKKVPVFATKPEAVALGAAVLGGVSHGRSTRVRSTGVNKLRAEMALQVQDVAPVAVGVRINYHAGDVTKWLPVKTIFDFDRRVPAGPIPVELNAAECAVHRSGASEGLSADQLLKAIANNEGAKGIPVRERAALDLRVQIVQRWTRDGEWKGVGDVVKPLVKETGSGDEIKEEACESVVLELSLGITGMITTSLVGDRYVCHAIFASTEIVCVYSSSQSRRASLFSRL